MWVGANHAFATLSVISEYDDSLACYSQLYFGYFLAGNENKYQNNREFVLVTHSMNSKPDYRIFQKQKTPPP
ncbi:hypothetical protein, partial [Yersinia mollaretii]